MCLGKDERIDSFGPLNHHERKKENHPLEREPR
jgi:hypothetical protein